MKNPFFRRESACDGIFDVLDVRFTKNCDNRCKFCIERKGLNSLDEVHYQTLANRTLETGIKNVSVLGGEPLLDLKRVTAYCKAIRDGVDNIQVTTSLPFTIHDNWEIFCELMALIDVLNISVQSTNWQDNNKILNATCQHNRMEMLERINLQFRDKVRVSLNLVHTRWSDGIDNPGSLIAALTNLKRFGTKTVKLNELQRASDEFVSFEQILNIKLNSPFAMGCQHMVDRVWLLEMINRCLDTSFREVINATEDDIPEVIMLKRSCFRVEPSLKPTLRDRIKQIANMRYKPSNKFKVLYENGALSDQWIKKSCSCSWW